MASAVTEVFHHWAHQTANRRGDIEGKRGDGRVFYEGPRFFSYGHHYVAGFVMPDGKSVLINGDKYSVSTGSHLSACRSASRHLQQFTVPDLTDLVAAYSGPLFSDKRARQHVERYITGYDRDSAIYVLTAAGVPKAAALYDRLRKEHDKAMAARKVREDKAAAESLIRHAKAVRDMPDSDFEAWVKRASRINGRNGPASMGFKYLIRELNRYLIAANKAGQKRAATVIRARKADLKKRAALEERRESVRRMRAHMQDAMEIIRLTLSQFASLHMPDKLELRRFANACRTLAGWPRVPAAAGRVLDSYASKAQAVLEMQARADNRERYRKEAANRAAWLAGGGGRYERYSDDRGGALIRAVDVTRAPRWVGDDSGPIVGGTLQTSHGAEIPLTHAIKAFRFLKLCRANGRAWAANGHTVKVGHYHIDRVEPSGDFKAGCHVIHWQEVERLAKELGVFDGPADDSALTPKHEAA